MSIRYSGAGGGTILALLGGVVLVALALWGIYQGTRASLENSNTGPIKRIEKNPAGK